MILYEEIFKEFQKKRVKYVIVGGIAFNFLGGQRNTLDKDISDIEALRILRRDV